MRYALFISALLHLGIMAAGFIAAPFMTVPAVVDSQRIPIELLTEAEFADRTSVMADRVSEEIADTNPSDDIEVSSLPDPIPTPQFEEPTIEETPEPVEQPKPEEPKPEPKDPPKKEEDKPKSEEDDFFSGLDDALVDLEEEDERKAPSEVVDPEGLSDQEAIGLGDTLTAAEEDLVREQMARRCFDQPQGVPNAEKLIVRVRFSLDREGYLIGQPEVLNATSIALSGNSWWRTTRDRAVQAVITCQPYDYLPAERYYVWSEMTLNFSPRGVM
ncbi:hypothetical protein HK107_11425 [Parvularcula sp. ZS-1/3]|uniref:Cell envelope biogenesis protein TolA n=1 Tax=Parvularcula mediterranea TaxID=2732508 RepID=A0A7Y3W5S8_9PROT|nr:hypothetical protein [Parvularcula mediterranea]NNU16929.1 hypothetical protein [Parvularcula mediterranea]